MSIPKWRRNESKLDAFFEAVKLRHIVTQMIMRSYGMKASYKPLVPDKVKEKHPDLGKLFKKVDEYQQVAEETKALGKYENWIITKTRSNLLKYTSSLVSNVAGANEIKCTFAFEFEERIKMQDMAICNIASIKQEVQFIEEFFDINLNRYMEYAEQLEKTKSYLYRWKKSTVKSYKEFLEKGNK